MGPQGSTGHLVVPPPPGVGLVGCLHRPARPMLWGLQDCLGYEYCCWLLSEPLSESRVDAVLSSVGCCGVCEDSVPPKARVQSEPLVQHGLSQTS